jgi:folate-binding protein YgfZ
MPALPLAAITATGPDAERYLQGQLTCDVARLGAGAHTLGAVLATDGKLISLLALTRADEDRFRLVTWAEHQALVLNRLAKFRIRVKVALEPSDERFDAPALPSPLWPLDQELLPASGPPLSEEAFQRHRLRLGAVHLPTDADPGLVPTAVPGLLAAGISLSKGCYVGQELVARTTSRQALPPVTLEVVSLAGADPAGALAWGLRAPLMHHGEEAGYVAALDPDAGVAVIALKRRFRGVGRLEAPSLNVAVLAP